MNHAVVLPNIRKIFIPDPGYTMFDCDLAGADAQVVAWECEDDDLKAAFRAGLDVHSKNAEDMWGTTFTKLQGSARKEKRQECKKGVHATNYLGSPPTLAKTLGWTIHQADQFQKRWFSLHPKIKQWHIRLQRTLDTTKTISNAFGYRRVYFDRPDKVLSQAVAWIPQSTVGLVSFFGALQLEAQAPWVEMLLQNHDSVVFQVKKADAARYSEIRRGLTVPIPYPDPLTIQWGLSSSALSWGDCKTVAEAA